MERDIAEGKLDAVLAEVEDDISQADSAICREVQNASAILVRVQSTAGAHSMSSSR
jgi:hypothetical protein